MKVKIESYTYDNKKPSPSEIISVRDIKYEDFLHIIPKNPWNLISLPDVKLSGFDTSTDFTIYIADENDSKMEDKHRSEFEKMAKRCNQRIWSKK